MRVETLPSEAQIQAAVQGPSWTLGNTVLYEFCRAHPSQSDPAAVISKFWLIGRAYSAAVERRRTSMETPLKPGENFYDHRLAPVYTRAGLDEIFAGLHRFGGVTSDNLVDIAEVHYAVAKTLQGITNQWKRSLASKYLHFHFRDLIFIYDSQAELNLRKYVPGWSRERLPENTRYDSYYLKFCRGVVALREAIATAYEVEMTPRDLDNLLLAPIGEERPE